MPTNQVTLTTRGHHAILAMAELVQKGEGNPLPLSEIAKASDISLSYLEQLFSCLRRYGLVKSYRGPGGGYVLAKAAQDITISEILSAVETCLPGGARKNKKKEASPSNHLWACVGNLLHLYLDRISIADVVNNNISAPESLFSWDSR